MATRVCLRMRSTSSALNAGCRLTSDSSVNAASVLLLGGPMLAPARLWWRWWHACAPMESASSAGSTELRPLVPSDSMRAAKAASPGLFGGFSSLPQVNQGCADDWQSVLLHQVDLQPVLQREGLRHRQMKLRSRPGLRRIFAPALRRLELF